MSQAPGPGDPAAPRHEIVEVEEVVVVREEVAHEETDREEADCEETVQRLYYFLDGELTDERRRAISAHLDSCVDCLDAVDFEAELRRVVADRCKDRVPDSLRDRVAEALAHEPHPGQC